MYKKIQIPSSIKPFIFNQQVKYPPPVDKNKINIRINNGPQQQSNNIQYDQETSYYDDGTDRQTIRQINNPKQPNRQQQIDYDKDLDPNKIDLRRLNRAKIDFYGVNNKFKTEDQQQRKQAIKMNFFRESARQKQRQFHQQNHQYLRMFSVMTASAMNQNKLYIKNHKQGLQKNGAKGQNKTSKQDQNFATVHLQLMTQVTSSLITYKFPIKEVYQLIPFKRQSIQFQFRQFLDSKYQFFIQQKPSQKVFQTRCDLQNVLQQGLTSQFKSAVIRTIGNLDFFDFLNLINNKNYVQKKARGIQYTNEVQQIATNSQTFQLNSDQEQLYMKDQLVASDQQTHQRMIICQQYDLNQTNPSVYFQTIQQYTNYKKFREVQFKFLKIYDKDITINTDIRNIISSQKIYLIQIVKELDLYIQLSKHTADLSIMKEILIQLKRKSQEFLKLLCCYTQSKILKQYNIQNYPQKIMVFIQKSIKYKRQILNPPEQLIDQYPILKIWYELPQKVFGYSRESLHMKYYQLVASIINYEQSINDVELERQLSMKRQGIKYPL